MMLKLKIRLFAIVLFCGNIAIAQTNQYKYQRKLEGINGNWHILKMPNELYQNINNDLSDLRIFGIKGKDTLEMPYLLKLRSDEVKTNDVDFKRINQTSNNGEYFFTFQPNKLSVINKIDLSFKQQNFDWKASLEGSNDNNQWFSIVKDSRILSIKNALTDYNFTKITFPDAKYAYFRVSIISNVKPELLSAKITQSDTTKGIYHMYLPNQIKTVNDEKNKRSEITVSVKQPSLISNLELREASQHDFYRPIKIEYATDSFKTDNGMQYQYSTLFEGTFSSLEKASYSFNNTILSNLKITIENGDNQPLNIIGINLQGNIYELITRFDEPNMNYFLFYGNKNAIAPNYDLTKFESKIPENLTVINIQEEEKNPAYSIKIENPLFENKIWLWALMAIIIALLGWFSFKMLKN
ncbi:hypothetical protein QWY86_07265 [Pedobacter aquatilis]|uniref:hypothetical protein n=1 Tax=Pedobacter aquatilis TaxID=351343 RepID=UPI0025B57C56|nr:hypothetical protein [Pedobacter aquatilis]MDN3586456.1 hypothetical protein [Pedobacter aquatilis]